MALKEQLMTDESVIAEVMGRLTDFERDLVSSLILAEEPEMMPVFVNSLLVILATTLVRLEALEENARKGVDIH